MKYSTLYEAEPTKKIFFFTLFYRILRRLLSPIFLKQDNFNYWLIMENNEKDQMIASLQNDMKIYQKQLNDLQAQLYRKIEQNCDRLKEQEKRILSVEQLAPAVLEQKQVNRCFTEDIENKEKRLSDYEKRISSLERLVPAVLEQSQINRRFTEDIKNKDKRLLDSEKRISSLEQLTPTVIEQKKINSRFAEDSENKNKLIASLENRIEDCINRENSLTVKLSATERLTAQLSDNNYLNTMDYVQFENLYRGSSNVIKERLKMYLKYFENCQCVYDLGCGRGEFVELLTESGINVTGVDFNQQFIDICHEKRLNVIYGDAIQKLREAPKEIDGVFSSQMIEHISKSKLLELCRICYSKLPKGGLAVFETPNVTSLITLANSFYLDPTHDKPVHPDLLKYFFHISGFSHTEIIFTEPSKEGLPSIPHVEDSADNSIEMNKAIDHLNKLLFNSQDYAVIAIK